MDIFEVFARRHSYRGEMHDEAVPREMLKEIVQAGIQAPSGKNTQSAVFVVIDDQAIVEEIRRMHQNNKAMQQAAAFIACIVDSSPECVLGEYNFQIEDCAAAVENMLLAITAFSLSAAKFPLAFPPEAALLSLFPQAARSFGQSSPRALQI